MNPFKTQAEAYAWCRATAAGDCAILLEDDYYRREWAWITSKTDRGLYWVGDHFALSY
jgi:hypothetical protein